MARKTLNDKSEINDSKQLEVRIDVIRNEKANLVCSVYHICRSDRNSYSTVTSIFYLTVDARTEGQKPTLVGTSSEARC